MSTTDEDTVRLQMADGESVVHLHLAASTTTVQPREGARVIEVDEDRLPEVVDQIVHRLRLQELIAIPVGKWRQVFDAVAFSLADNEAWQEIDAAATVELNTRDPQLWEPGEFQTLASLFRALMSDGERTDQGVMLVTPAAPMLVELDPEGAVRISLGNRALADEVSESVQARPV